MTETTVKYPKLVGVNLNDDLYDKIKLIADEKKWSMSQTVRILIEKALEDH